MIWAWRCTHVPLSPTGRLPRVVSTGNEPLSDASFSCGAVCCVINCPECVQDSRCTVLRRDSLHLTHKLYCQWRSRTVVAMTENNECGLNKYKTGPVVSTCSTITTSNSTIVCLWNICRLGIDCMEQFAMLATFGKRWERFTEKIRRIL